MRTTALMKAIVYAGGLIKLEEIEKPVPADDEVLIKVRAASVNPLDYHPNPCGNPLRPHRDHHL
jgi:threonine dehydrogenase-like Zn-dependent dehydrogenase